MNFSHASGAWRAAFTGLALLFTLAGCDDGNGGVALTGEFPIVYVERPFPVGRNGLVTGDDLVDPGAFHPGARLLLKRRAAPGAPETDITTGLMPPGARYDVRDASPSWDGTKLLFALRGPFIPGAQDEDQPRWAIWVYDIVTAKAHRVIESDLVAEEGNDIMPAWLPDGRIVFSSTRQRGTHAVLVDEGKPQFAGLERMLDRETYALHVMDADGGNIRQISFNDSHDLWPAVLPDGRVLFARNVRNLGNDTLNFYTVRPDGRELSPAFGTHSHDTVDNLRTQFTRPRVMDDGRVLSIIRPFETRFYGGAIVAVDVIAYSDRDRPLASTTGTGGLETLDGNGWTGEARATATGRYVDAVPLGDASGRLLVSWSACRLQDSTGRIIPCTGNDMATLDEAPPVYGVFVFDPATHTRLPVVVPQEGRVLDSLAVLVPRTPPAYLRDGEAGNGLDAALLAEGAGILDIRSVYDLDGTFNPVIGTFTSLAQTMSAPPSARPVRFLRLEKSVPIPGRRVREISGTAFGVNPGFGMREILGYVPIEPDGSVRVRVPANVPFSFSIVDAIGRRVSANHAPWLQLVPGEVRSCNGCHAVGSASPHGRNDTPLVPVLNTGAASATPFPRTGTSDVPEIGETMAQLRARLDGTAPAPTPDVLFTDRWADPAVRAADPPLALRYADLVTPAPGSDACGTAWVPSCRTVIHYETHIHPLWSVDRRVFDTDGTTLLEDHTCTACHNVRDAAGNLQVPAGQLDLRDGYSGEAADQMSAYRELFFPDSRQVLYFDPADPGDTGSVVDETVPLRDANGDIVYQLDADGNVVIDPVTGQPAPVMVPVPVNASMRAGFAISSVLFFPRFAAGGSHAGWLSPAELRLLSEWVDLGAQYFNDPFAAPAQ